MWLEKKKSNESLACGNFSYICRLNSTVTLIWVQLKLITIWMALHLYIENTAVEFFYYLYISNFICQLYLNKSEKRKKKKKKPNNHIHSIYSMPGPVTST